MKIVISGNYGAKNIGDEMILEGILEKLRTLNPKAEITVLSGNPEETKERFGVSSVEKFPAGIKSGLKYLFSIKNPTKKAVKDCDVFILGGGGLFGSLKFRANIIWGIQGLMALRYKKPVIICGQSIEKIESKIVKNVVKRIFSKAVLIAVRDNESKKILKKMKIKKKIHVLPDLAFRVKAPETETKRKKIMTVALRQMDGLNEEFKENIKNFLNWLIKAEDWKIRFINFQNGESGDAELHEEIIKAINKNENIEYVEQVKNNKELFDKLGESKCVLAMRLHSIIAAIKTKTPFIAIDYAPKVRGFLRYAKLNNYLIELDKLSSGEIFSKFNEVENNEKTFIKEMDNFNKNAYNRHLEAEKKFKDFFASLAFR